MQQISILGCGWLGLPLAKSLLDKGFSVNGSTTSIDKISVLKNVGIIPFQILAKEDSIDGEMDLFLENSEILIIDIPPKLRGDYKENFVKKIHNLIPFIENNTIKKIIFISSTSVYGDQVAIVNEETIPKPATESGKQLLEVEKLLQNNSNFKTTVIRFGGLIGEDRNPTKFLAGKKDIENPQAPINFIHQVDCIGIIEEIVRQAQNDKFVWNQIFNAVAPFHPTRKEYYTQKALELNTAIPQFNEINPSVGKTILSNKVVKILKYDFLKPQL